MIWIICHVSFSQRCGFDVNWFDFRFLRRLWAFERWLIFFPPSYSRTIDFHLIRVFQFSKEISHEHLHISLFAPVSLFTFLADNVTVPELPMFPYSELLQKVGGKSLELFHAWDRVSDSLGIAAPRMCSLTGSLYHPFLLLLDIFIFGKSQEDAFSPPGSVAGC